MEKIKLLVVDDSMLYREVLTRYVRLDDMIMVVGKGGDAYSARDLILKYEPDVMTLDLELPRMDGVDFLKKLLPQYYIPTVVISSAGHRKNDCLSAGAVEFLKKPETRSNLDMVTFAAELCKSVRRAYKTSHPDSKIDGNKIPAALQNAIQATAASLNVAIPPAAAAPAPVSTVKPQAPTNSSSSSVNSSISATTTAAASVAASLASAKTSHDVAAAAAPQPKPTPAPIPSGKHSKLKKSEAVIALGASTGGTEALEKVIKNFPADTPPVIIVQHMPAGFTKLFAERLDRSCKMRVKEAQDGDRLERGLIIIGAGEYHLRLCRDAKGWYVSSKPGEKVSGHCPSVDVMFNSVADVAGPLAIGAILTGMGRDGADGLLRMRKAGAFTVGQDKETCVVYGMPMEAYNCGAVEVQAPLQNIADVILNQLY